MYKANTFPTAKPRNLLGCCSKRWKNIYKKQRNKAINFSLRARNLWVSPISLKQQ